MQRYSFERTFEIRKKNEIKFDSEKGASQQQQRTVQRKLNNWHESSNNKRQKASKNHTHAIRCDVLQHGCCLYSLSIFVYHSVCAVLSRSDCLCQSVCLWLFILSFFTVCVCCFLFLPVLNLSILSARPVCINYTHISTNATTLDFFISNELE